jgi:hypothetical protein
LLLLPVSVKERYHAKQVAEYSKYGKTGFLETFKTDMHPDVHSEIYKRNLWQIAGIA